MSAQNKTQQEARRGPDFLCIGAQKSATTWLNWNLLHHPDYWAPPCKEVHYFYKANAPVSDFDMRYRVNNFYAHFQNMMKTGNLDIPKLQWFGGKCIAPFQDDEWYLSLFDDIEGKVKGDITPSNSTLSLEQVRHVHQVLGDERKIIFMLRNPLERVWSQLCQEMNIGRLSAQASLQEICAHIDSDAVDHRSDYMRTLEHWERYYPEIHIELFDDVMREPHSVLKRICDLTGLEYSQDVFAKSAPVAANKTQGKKLMPDEVAVYIAQKYLPMTQSLIERLGSGTPVDHWLQTMKSLASTKG